MPPVCELTVAVFKEDLVVDVQELGHRVGVGPAEFEGSLLGGHHLTLVDTVTRISGGVKTGTIK